MGQFARALELPYDSPEHRDIRDTVVVAGGGFLAARYFLTVLTGTSYDFHDVPELQYLDALRRFLIENVSPDAVGFCLDCEGEGHVSYVIVPVLMSLFYERTGVENPHKSTKQDRALVLLARNPHWDDASIRDTLKTTDKQMERWSNYRLARRMQRRFNNGDR